MQFEQFIHVKADKFVVDDFEEGRVGVKFTAFFQVAFDDGDSQRSEAANLTRPLMFERSGADDDCLLNIAHFLEQCGGGNRLHGFAKSHVIGEHGAATKGKVHRAFFLIRI